MVMWDNRNIRLDHRAANTLQTKAKWHAGWRTVLLLAALTVFLGRLLLGFSVKFCLVLLWQKRMNRFTYPSFHNPDGTGRNSSTISRRKWRIQF